MLNPIENTIKGMMNQTLKELEDKLGGDCLTINAPLQHSLPHYVMDMVEELKREDTHRNKIFVILTTLGGDAVTVERVVHVLRNHYKEVNFIVPDCAYSAGTILCMSGDNILMDYFSVLGPIDPQVQNKEGNFVPALGYLEKINALLEKAQSGEISQAEFLILQNFDLAELTSYEQARNLTADLLKTWLVKYKFKNWDFRETSNKAVTQEDKETRAAEIADILSDYTKWKSHGRPLNMETLESIGLKIEDYGADAELLKLIRSYQVLCLDYMNASGISNLLHTRRYL